MTTTVDIKASKYWEDKFMRWFYNGELADKQSARIMGERMQKSIDALAPHIPVYREVMEDDKKAGMPEDASMLAVINDYESAKEILRVGEGIDYV